MLDRLFFAFVAVALFWIAFILYQHYHAWQIKRQLPHSEATTKPRILFFHGSHCGSCVQQERFLDQLDGQWLPLIEKIDVQRQPELTSKYNVMSVPMTILITKDQTVHRINYGLADRGTLETQLRAIESL